MSTCAWFHKSARILHPIPHKNVKYTIVRFFLLGDAEKGFKFFKSLNKFRRISWFIRKWMVTVTSSWRHGGHRTASLSPKHEVYITHWIIDKLKTWFLKFSLCKIFRAKLLYRYLMNLALWPNLTGMVTGWSPTKIVQMVLIGCICRSQGEK